MSSVTGTRPRAARGLDRRGSYRVPRPSRPCDLRLDGNEGARPDPAVLAALDDVERLRRYPDPGELERRLAERLGTTADRVLLTCGADEALLRASLAFLEPGRSAVVPVPTFEMLVRYVELSGAELREVSWPGGAYPAAEVLRAVDDTTGLVAVVTPNNPTGAVASRADVETLCDGARNAVVLVDRAYGEFADGSPVPPDAAQVVEVRTLSKAWGLAGLRVGYAVGDPELLGWMRRAGGPYPVSGPALELARRRLETGAAEVERFVRRVRTERTLLAALLTELGFEVEPSQANFVFARSPRAGEVWSALADEGVAVRAFEAAGLRDALRITCPGDESAFDRLTRSLVRVGEVRR